MDNGPSRVSKNELGKRLKSDGWSLVSFGEEQEPCDKINRESWKGFK